MPFTCTTWRCGARGLTAGWVVACWNGLKLAPRHLAECVFASTASRTINSCATITCRQALRNVAKSRCDSLTLLGLYDCSDLKSESDSAAYVLFLHVYAEYTIMPSSFSSPNIHRPYSVMHSA